MSKYPRIIYGYDLRETQYMCKQFMKDNPTAKVKRVGQWEFKFEVNGEETWIMHHTHYEEWCKGRTYYNDGKLMHSGYPIESEEQKNG